MKAYPTPLLPAALRAAVILAIVTASALAAEPTKETPPPAAPPAKEERVVTLHVHEVLTAPPKLCFGLALEVWKDNATSRIMNLYVTKVRPGSSAAEEGIKPRTRIDRIDGQPVEQLTGSFLKGGDLNKFFINRKLGAKIVLEILPEGGTQPKTVVLTEKPWFEFETRIHDLDGINSFDQLRAVPRARQ